MNLSTPLIMLPGVGPERAGQLARLGITTVGQLLLCRPRRYEDRRRVAPISSLQLRENSSARGRIVDLGVKYYHNGSKSVFELILDDGTGRLHCRWWNLPYLEKQFRRGSDLIVYGKVNSVRPRTIDHPETEILDRNHEPSIHLERIVPVYPLTEGLSQRWLRALIFRVLEKAGDELREPWNGSSFPGFLTHRDAVRQLHFPTELSEAESARRRLALDELLALQLEMKKRRTRLSENSSALPCRGTNQLMKPFLKQLEFALTQAQQQVLREIRNDLGGNVPMRRLLQGDVGSGKTVVAACAALMTVESGFNVLLMAPTEILAEQHFTRFCRWFNPPGITVRLRTGHRQESSGSSSSQASITIGTHALIEDSFKEPDVGLVIIDEQHKFGVAQRQKLLRKGHYPHLLIMTATPIPRTLALTCYGDLDVSTISLPPQGRGSIKTYIRSPDHLPKVWDFIERQLAEGRQAYVVCPRIEETGASGLKAVTKEFNELQTRFERYHVGLLHGRMSAVEKEQVMEAFRRNEIHLLLSTQLIEVGVDVPNATMLVVQNAEQFGLAQLHQLRGRIGRGAHSSHCILIQSTRAGDAADRLRILADTADGFEIAEADMQMRGPGDLLGHDQSGLPPLAFANLARDADLVQLAREWAHRMISADDLTRPSERDLQVASTPASPGAPDGKKRS